LGELSRNNERKVDAILAAMPVKQSLPTRFAVMTVLGRTSGKYYDQSPEQILVQMKGMSPREIAAILAELDFKYVQKEAEVLSLMPPEEAAAVLGSMGSDTAELFANSTHNVWSSSLYGYSSPQRVEKPSRVSSCSPTVACTSQERNWPCAASTGTRPCPSLILTAGRTLYI